MTDTRELTLDLETDVVYISGTVNGNAVTWQFMGDGQWNTSAARSADDIYRIEITAVKANGLSYEMATTVYYGMHLITDRTQEDVKLVKSLAEKIANGTATAAEKAEYLTDLKGSYNASDLNRVGSALIYVNDILTENGYGVLITAKTNWQKMDMFYLSDLRNYLEDVERLRGALAIIKSTPKIPPNFNRYDRANDIEKIIEDVHFLLQNMIAAYRYSDTFYSGEDDYR